MPTSRLPDTDDSVVLVLTTERDGECAEALARAIIERRVGACVTTHEIRSMYRWEGEIVEGREIQLVVKTTGRSLPGLRKVIDEVHSYDLPEIVVLEGVATTAYAQWVGGEVG